MKPYEEALRYASKKGHIKILKALLGCPNIEVNDMNVFGRTALHYACRRGHIKIIKALLAHPEIDPKLMVMTWSTRS